MRISGAAYRKVPAVRADEKWSAMVASPTSATFAVPSAVSRMLLVLTSLHAASRRSRGRSGRFFEIRITRTGMGARADWDAQHSEQSVEAAARPRQIAVSAW